MKMPSRSILVSLILTAALQVFGNSRATAESEVQPVRVIPVAAVDIERYTGLWYEIAKIPNRFQKQCAYGTTAEYMLREDGSITVLNRCVKEDGSLDEAEGLAKFADESTSSRLKVSFVSLLGWRPFWGDYWIIGLDEEYGWAVIGTPDRKYGWVLARTPTLPEATMDEVFAILKHNGYEWSSFEPSPHREARR